MDFQSKNTDIIENRHWWDEDWRRAKRTFDESSNFWVSTDKVKYKFVRRLINLKSSAVEVGCGTATISSWLYRDTSMDVYILDQSWEALQLAIPRFNKIGCAHYFALQGDAFHLPFKDCSIDFVHSYGLLEHFKDPKPIIGEMIRVLKSGGVFFADIAPRKFSLDLLFDVLLLPLYIFLIWVRRLFDPKPFHRTEFARRVGEWKYLFSFFFKNHSHFNKFATGGFVSRLDCKALLDFLSGECRLDSIRMTGSMLLPSNVYRVLWKMSPSFHRCLQEITENKRWTIPLTSGIWVSGKKI
jgi:ubiquinone/menaquinone biosynthesis C-methylase UbiE